MMIWLPSNGLIIFLNLPWLFLVISSSGFDDLYKLYNFLFFFLLEKYLAESFSSRMAMFSYFLLAYVYPFYLPIIQVINAQNIFLIVDKVNGFLRNLFDLAIICSLISFLFILLFFSILLS